MTTNHADALRPTVADIDLGAIRRNVGRIRSACGVEVCAVVKADGYGHGAVRAARAAVAGGASWVAVALVEEGEELRSAGITVPILLLAEPPRAAVDRLVRGDMTPVVYSRVFIDALQARAEEFGDVLDVHVKADTGMHRVGLPRADWAEVLDHLAATPVLRVTGLMTHLACADEVGNPANERQLEAFDEFLAMARARGIDPEVVHAANTAGALMLPGSRHTMVRAGIGIYGLSPSSEVTAAAHGLESALTWRTRVSFAKRVEAGAAVSYGHRWSAPADGWIATLPVGYADGVPRRVGGRIDVVIDGARRPMVGTVCMDQVLVWCGDHAVERGAEVVLLGRQRDVEVTGDDWAAAAETITYEISCGIQKRVPRREVDSADGADSTTNDGG